MSSSGRTILVVAAHPDDEVLGCGASIAKWSEAGDDVHVLILAEGATSRNIQRDCKAMSQELSILAESARAASMILSVTSVTMLEFPDNRMDSIDRLEVIKAVEKHLLQIKPCTVVTHHVGDVNIDHQIVHEAVVTACRPQPDFFVRRILSFEVPSSTEWQSPQSAPAFQPNMFENVTATLDHKLKALEAYSSEMRLWPHPRSLRAVEHLARWRGASCGVEAAEAFQIIRELN